MTTPDATVPTPLHNSDPNSQANAALGIYGITGTGKTSLAITACEEAWEVYKKITHWYASDLGGWGSKLLSLVRLGIVRVWYLRNHNDPFATMELASQGYWPEKLQDPATGLAAPDVQLIGPRMVKWSLVCPNGHDTGVTYSHQAIAQAAQVKCPVCGQLTTASNAQRVSRVVTKPGLFAQVGHYVYDSMTQMNEWGLLVLPDKSAKGELPASSTGGSALGSADALREAGMSWGTGSKAQVGFLQNRTPGWIANIRAIPDQVLPPILTFGVELSKGDDESGGMPLYAPKIAGNARTSSVPGWLGNCLFATKEPHNPPETTEHGMVKMHHRLWLSTHVSPTDRSNIPIVAKHRGEPFGIPNFLEDPYIENPMDPKQAEKAWSVCSLRVFYRYMRAQQEAIEARDRERYKDAPGLTEAPEADVVLEEIQPQSGQPAVLGVPGNVVRRSRRPMATGAVSVVSTVPVAASVPVQAVSAQAAVAQTALVEAVSTGVGAHNSPAVVPPLGNAPLPLVTAPPPPTPPPAPAAPAAVPVSSAAPPPVAPQAGGSTIPRIRRTPRPPA